MRREFPSINLDRLRRSVIEKPRQRNPKGY